MKTAEIREAFLSYFERQGHTRVRQARGAARRPNTPVH